MSELSTQKALAVAELNPVITELSAFESTIESIDVVDEETQADVGDLVKLLNSRRAKVEGKRKSLVKPLNDVVKEINALFKVPIQRIDAVILIAKQKMNRFSEAKLAIEREKKRQEEEEARKEAQEARELAERLAAHAGDTGEQVAYIYVAQAEEKVEKVEKKAAKVEVNRGKAATISTQRIWKAEVFDKSLLIKAIAEGHLSDHFLEVNMPALTAYSRETKMERKLYGVSFFEEVRTAVR